MSTTLMLYRLPLRIALEALTGRRWFNQLDRDPEYKEYFALEKWVGNDLEVQPRPPEDYTAVPHVLSLLRKYVLALDALTGETRDYVNNSEFELVRTSDSLLWAAVYGRRQVAWDAKDLVWVEADHLPPRYNDPDDVKAIANEIATVPLDLCLANARASVDANPAKRLRVKDPQAHAKSFVLDLHSTLIDFYAEAGASDQLIIARKLN